jgi:replicative DNA helicase
MSSDSSFKDGEPIGNLARKTVGFEKVGHSKGRANGFRDRSREGGNNLRKPPFSNEGEESVIGAVLLDNEAINGALEKINYEDFYRVAHKAIFQAMTLLSEKGEPIDALSVAEELKRLGVLEECGGIDNLVRLASIVPASGNVAYYAKVVKENSLRRRVIQEATQAINDAFNQEDDVESFLDSIEQRFMSVSESRIHASFHKVSDVVQDSIKLVEKLYDQKEPITGVASGFFDLDRLTAGFQPSDLVIIAARPAMGKTALVLTMAQHAALDLKRPVALFSLEMSKEQLVLRMLCSEAKVANSKVRTGYLGENDFPKLVDAASRLADASIFIDDTPAVTITEIRAKARRLHRECPLSLIIVDYLQLVRSPNYSHSREQEIADISRSLKALAKELSLPVIALSQLNRSVESRNDKRPMMSDLRESGAIEQDADLITFIYRDEVYNETSPDKGIAEVIISKQRSGPTGVVRLAFIGEYTRFESLVERDDFQLPANSGFYAGNEESSNISESNISKSNILNSDIDPRSNEASSFTNKPFTRALTKPFITKPSTLSVRDASESEDDLF